MFAAQWQPFCWTTSDWNQLRGDVERAVRQLADTTLRSVNTCRYPAVNLWEQEDQFVVEAELPGLELEEIEIYVDGDNQLTLKGERKAEDAEDGTWHHRERGFGSFQRTLELPREVDVARVSAELTQGVLTVTLPKKPEAKPRRVQVQVG